MRRCGPGTCCGGSSRCVWGRGGQGGAVGRQNHCESGSMRMMCCCGCRGGAAQACICAHNAYVVPAGQSTRGTACTTKSPRPCAVQLLAAAGCADACESTGAPSKHVRMHALLQPCPRPVAAEWSHLVLRQVVVALRLSVEFHLFLTALSVRPGSSLAMADHLLPLTS